MSILAALEKARASGDPDLLELASFAAGKLPAEHQHRLRERLLRSCAALPCFADMPPKTVAREIERGWGRYCATAGDRERGLQFCPQHRIGRPDAFYFELHKLGFRPLKYRRLLDILVQ